MTRFTITLSAQALENLKETQGILKTKLGGGHITQGFAIGYVLQEFLEKEQKKNKKENE